MIMTKKTIGAAITESAHKKLKDYSDKVGKTMSYLFSEYVLSLHIGSKPSLLWQSFKGDGATASSLRIMIYLDEKLAIKFNKYCLAIGKSRNLVLNEWIESLPKVREK